VLVLIAGGVGLWRVLTDPGPAEGGGPPAGPGGREGPLPVGVEPVAVRSVPDFREYVATVRAIEEVQVRARVSGYLVDMPFTEGGLVEEGEVLFRIDPRPFEARVARLQGERRAEQARRRFAQTQIERFLPLLDEDFATEERIDELRSERDGAAARVDALEAQIRRAMLDVEYATIVSRVTGRAGFASVDVGDLVEAGGETPLTTVVQLDPIYVTFEPTERELERMLDGGEPLPLTVEVLHDGGGAYPHSGTLSQVDNRFAETTGTIRARATVPNPGHALRPGQFVRARLIFERIESALLVPSRALGSDQGRRFVYLFADGTAERRFVETGGVYGDDTLILEGLDEGDRVIVDNLQRVRDGMPVEVRGRAQAQQQGNAPE
jgi:RND family efflux transporter MFP subunit